MTDNAKHPILERRIIWKTDGKADALISLCALQAHQGVNLPVVTSYKCISLQAIRLFLSIKSQVKVEVLVQSLIWITLARLVFVQVIIFEKFVGRIWGAFVHHSILKNLYLLYRGKLYFVYLFQFKKSIFDLKI